MLKIYYFLPVIIFLGVITSYEDVKKGKIRNKWLLLSLGLALTLHLILFLQGLSGNQEMLLLLSNFAISIIFAFALWNFNFWSAGDGKLFITYSALIPVGFYSSPFVSFFPSFNLFINVIVPFFVFFLFKMVFCSSMKKVKKSFMEGFKGFPGLFISLLSVKWFVSIINENLFNFQGVLSGFFIHAGIYFVVNTALTKTLERYKIKKFKPVYFYLGLIVLRLLINPEGLLNVKLLYTVLFTTIGYSVLFRSLFNVVYSMSYKKKRICNLMEGDVIFKEKEKGRKKAKRKKTSILDFIEAKPEGIDKTDLKKIKELSKSKSVQLRTVPVADTIPFAPLMFIGALITLIFGNVGNFIYLFMYIYNAIGGLI